MTISPNGQYNTLQLKWGTLKAWDFTHCEAAHPLIQRFSDLGMCVSAAGQENTPEQVKIILQLIDLCDDPRGIYLGWTSEYVSKKKAKKYIRDYGKDRKKK